MYVPISFSALRYSRMRDATGVFQIFEDKLIYHRPGLVEPRGSATPRPEQPCTNGRVRHGVHARR
jgi:hypothetical protein